MTDVSQTLLDPGTPVGPYRIVRHLGSGAFGAVYEAIKSPLQKRIALKMLHRTKATDPNVVQRFMQEARAAASLKHPHIVDVDDIGVIDGGPFLAMEFLEGESLSARIERESRLTVSVALELLFPIFSAVAAVHEKGIVHRDLKPDNIHLWSPLVGQVHPKLLDFGVAKMQEADAHTAMTQTGAIMGTPVYMSAEQWGGSKLATGASDQWALAVILFECVTGRVPFEADGLHALMRRVSFEPPTPLRALDPSLPVALEQAILKALEKRPEARFADVRAFGHALLPFADPLTRARWGREFGGDPTVMATAPAVPRIPDTADWGPPQQLAFALNPPPDTLTQSVREVTHPPDPPQTKWPRILALAVLGLVGALGGTLYLHATRTVPTPSSHGEPQPPPHRPLAPSPDVSVPTVPVVVAAPVVPAPSAQPVVPTPNAPPVVPPVVVAPQPIAPSSPTRPPSPGGRGHHGRHPTPGAQPLDLQPSMPPAPPPTQGPSTPIV